MESRFGISQFFEYLLPGTLFVLMMLLQFGREIRGWTSLNAWQTEGDGILVSAAFLAVSMIVGVLSGPFTYIPHYIRRLFGKDYREKAIFMIFANYGMKGKYKTLELYKPWIWYWAYWIKTIKNKGIKGSVETYKSRQSYEKRIISYISKTLSYEGKKDDGMIQNSQSQFIFNYQMAGRIFVLTGLAIICEVLLHPMRVELMIAYSVVMVFAWITYMFYYKQRFQIIVSGYDYYCARNPQEKEIFSNFVNGMKG